MDESENGGWPSDEEEEKEYSYHPDIENGELQSS
jgi:hypothetical protein